MRFSTSLVLFITLVLGVAESAFAQNYDLVISNGRVMDPETNFDPETVTDNAGPDIGKNSLPSTGIPT